LFTKIDLLDKDCEKIKECLCILYSNYTIKFW